MPRDRKTRSVLRKTRSVLRKTRSVLRKTRRHRGAGSILSPFYYSLKYHYEWMVRTYSQKEKEYREAYETMLDTFDRHQSKSKKDRAIRATLRPSAEIKIKEIYDFEKFFRDETIKVIETIQELPRERLQNSHDVNIFIHSYTSYFEGIKEELESFKIDVTEQYANKFLRLLIHMEQMNGVKKEYSRRTSPENLRPRLNSSE